MTGLPLLDFYCQGQVSQGELQEICSTLEEWYSRVSSALPQRVEVRLFDTPAGLAAFLASEKADLGIGTSGDDAFTCTHDAWRGSPRLLVCAQRLFALSPLARSGTLRHEAAHTVLHGSQAYYVFHIPPDCLGLSSARGLSLSMLQQVLYYCAIAVKDLEVTRLLLSQGYRDCQLAFAQIQFLPSEEDKLAWSLAMHHPQARLFFFASQLKTLLLGWPLEAAGLMQLEEAANSMLNYMETREQKRLLNLATNIAEQSGNDTHENVRLALSQVLRERL